MSSIPSDLPLLYDKNRRTFILILSFIIGILYLVLITSNGLKSFTNAWRHNPEQEHYVLIPYAGNSAELKADTDKIERFLKKSNLIKGFRKIDEHSFQRLFNPNPTANKAWIETIPFPIFIELNLRSSDANSAQVIEKQIKKIVSNAQVYTQPRYSSEFAASFGVLNFILDWLIGSLVIAFLAVLVLMTRAHFSQQEKNIERLSMLGATPSYIKKLYCWFMARCIALSSLYGFLGGGIACWIVHILTEHMSFFPYGFELPSLIFYIVLPHSCLLVGVIITYFLITNLLKKSWSCA